MLATSFYVKNGFPMPIWLRLTITEDDNGKILRFAFHTMKVEDATMIALKSTARFAVTGAIRSCYRGDKLEYEITAAGFNSRGGFSILREQERMVDGPIFRVEQRIQ